MTIISGAYTCPRERASAGALRRVPVLLGVAGRRPLGSDLRRATGTAGGFPARFRGPEQPPQTWRADPTTAGGRARDPPQQHGGPDRRHGGGGLGATAPEPAGQTGV